MQQVAQRLFYPMLVSFTLSGIGALLMYIIAKKKQKRIDRIKKKKNEIPVLDNARFGPYFLELPVNSRMIPAVVGRGGQEIMRIESTTNTRIFFREETDCMTGDRVVVVCGKPDDVALAIKEISTIANSEPIIEEYVHMVPVRTIRKLLQNNGKLLKRMQNTTFAKIIFDKTIIRQEMNSGTLKKVIIKGKEQHIKWALKELQKQITYDEVNEQETENNAVNRARRSKPPNSLSPDEVPYDTYSSGKWGIEKEIKNKDIGKPYEVFVTSVESPKMFHIQVISEKNRLLDDLVSEMKFYYEDDYNRKGHIIKKIDHRQIVAAKFKDDKWYRAQIISIVSTSEVDLYFCDFGDCGTVNVENIYELSTEFLRLRFQAQETSLYGVKPVGDSWSKEAIEIFAKLSAEGDWVPRTAVNRAWEKRTIDSKNIFQIGREGNPIPVIELFEKRGDEFVSINKELIRLNLAIEDEEAWNQIKIMPPSTTEDNEPRYSAEGSETSSESSSRYQSPFHKTSLRDLRELGKEHEEIITCDDGSETPDWKKSYPEMQSDSSVYTDDSDEEAVGGEQKNEAEAKENGKKEGAVIENKESGLEEAINRTGEGKNGHEPEQVTGSAKETYI